MAWISRLSAATAVWSALRASASTSSRPPGRGSSSSCAKSVLTTLYRAEARVRPSPRLLGHGLDPAVVVEGLVEAAELEAGVAEGKQDAAPQGVGAVRKRGPLGASQGPVGGEKVAAGVGHVGRLEGQGPCEHEVLPRGLGDLHRLLDLTPGFLEPSLPVEHRAQVGAREHLSLGEARLGEALSRLPIESLRASRIAGPFDVAARQGQPEVPRVALAQPSRRRAASSQRFSCWATRKKQ